MALLLEADYERSDTIRRVSTGTPPMLPATSPRVQAASLQGQTDWPLCNLFKGPNLSGVDPLDNRIAVLFHPRRQHWTRHFAWDGGHILGITRHGRATVAVLNLNQPTRVATRELLRAAGRWPGQ